MTIVNGKKKNQVIIKNYDLALLESDEETFSVPSTILSKGVKEGKGLKISTPSKLLTKFPVLLGTNSNS